MIKAKISHFEIEKDFDSITFKPLIQIGTKEYDKTTKQYKWTFPIEKLKEIQTILGIGLEFNKEEVEIVKTLCPAFKEDINIPRFKGKGIHIFQEFPKIIRVIEKRKVENKETGEITVEDVPHDCNKEIIRVIWEGVILKQPMGKAIRTGTVIKNIFELLDIKVDSNKPRCLRDTRAYMVYYNPIMHILQEKKLIIYHLYGAVERISNGPLEFQTKFEVVEQ